MTRIDRKEMYDKIQSIISDISDDDTDKALESLNEIAIYFDDTELDYRLFKASKVFKIIMILDYLIEKRPVLYKAIRYYDGFDNDMRALYNSCIPDDRVILNELYFNNRQTNYEDISLDELKKLKEDIVALKWEME